jgi:hypothetical protein
MSSKMRYNYYKAKKVPIDYSIISKLLEQYSEPYPLTHDRTKELFSKMDDLKIFKLLDQVFSLNEELYNSLIKILNDDSTDEDYKNYVKLLEEEKELFKFGSYKETLLRLQPSIIGYNPEDIDFCILANLVIYMDQEYLYFEHFSPNDLRNHILSLTINDNYQILLLFHKLNKNMYYFFLKIIFRKTWTRGSGECDHEDEVDNLDYTEFTDMLEETIKFAYYAREYNIIDLKIKNKEDYECEFVGHMSKEEFVSFVSKMNLNEYESFIRYLIHIDSSKKLLELFKKFLFSVFKNGMVFENSRTMPVFYESNSDVDYTKFITIMNKFE